MQWGWSKWLPRSTKSLMTLLLTIYQRLIQYQKVKLQFQERKSGKSSSSEEYKVWTKVILLWSRPNLELSPERPEAGWVLLLVQESTPCIERRHLRIYFMFNLGFICALLLQFSFYSLHSLCLQAFAFQLPPFFAFSLCWKGCDSLGVHSLQFKR